jgi:two-component system, chemotaxis family, CheB/CheR fusion protein
LWAPNAALSVGLALYELVTNAVKYGALSSPSGIVNVEWEFVSDKEPGRLLLHWRESGGPPVTPPERRGFGTELLERQLRHELNGATALVFDEAGLRATLELPESAISKVESL